ncbi:DUF6525 family protein [Pseudodonghicola xiamenensis]|uniref:Uncharacterized protein n=1 Tax=Pseudodonghicola xiamenensis TaxID=337702 RepID=A0A8J3H7Q9_9RHOB|nr:DUF6525 family protein [Pseudodonghicola xiamenensis]GHG90849.1 hypothetical protein GCM10010961_21870 [Pseudodonghicola xiamenensis]
MRANGQSSLKRRPRAGDPMTAYDRLPVELRQWLASAALPWSPRSALRAWRAALARADGDPDAARARLSATEARQLRRDTARIWGAAHPQA